MEDSWLDSYYESQYDGYYQDDATSWEEEQVFQDQFHEECHDYDDGYEYDDGYGEDYDDWE